MKRYDFYKTEESRWYIDLPEWKGTQEDLELVSGADTLLDRISKGNRRITVELSTRYEDRQTGENYATLKLHQKHAQILGGGADYICEGETVWLCDVTKFIFKKFPLYIIFKVVEYHTDVEPE